MNFKKLVVAALISGLCTIASADKKPKLPKTKSAAQHEDSAVRSENKSEEQQAAELKREEIDLLHQAEAKHQQAKALIQREKALRSEEVSQEHAGKTNKAGTNKKDGRVLGGEVKQEGSERAQLNRQAEELEKEREALTRQANEKAAERKAIEARIRANDRPKH